MDFLISSAFAQAAGDAAQQPSAIASFVPLILLFCIFYFLVIRPQNKKMKAHREMVASVQKGDEVITAGGIFGKVTKVVAGEEGDSLNKVMVKIADGVEIAVQQNTIGRVLTERTPAKTEEQTSAKASKKAAPKAANDNR